MRKMLKHKKAYFCYQRFNHLPITLRTTKGRMHLRNFSFRNIPNTLISGTPGLGALYQKVRTKNVINICLGGVNILEIHLDFTHLLGSETEIKLDATVGT